MEYPEKDQFAKDLVNIIRKSFYENNEDSKVKNIDIYDVEDVILINTTFYVHNLFNELVVEATKGKYSKLYTFIGIVRLLILEDKFPFFGEEIYIQCLIALGLYIEYRREDNKVITKDEYEVIDNIKIWIKAELTNDKTSEAFYQYVRLRHIYELSPAKPFDYQRVHQKII